MDLGQGKFHGILELLEIRICVSGMESDKVEMINRLFLELLTIISHHMGAQTCRARIPGDLSKFVIAKS